MSTPGFDIGTRNRAGGGGVERREFLKLLGATVVVGSGASVLSACGDSESSSGSEDGRLAFLQLTNQQEYNITMAAAGAAAAKALGFSFEALDGRLDSNVQFNDFNQSVNKGVSGVLAISVDGSNVPTIGRGAQTEEVYFSNVWAQPPWFTPWDVGDYYSLYTRPREIPGQAEVTRLLFERIGGEGKVFRVAGIKGSSDDLIRSAGTDPVLDEFPDIEYVGQLFGKWNPQDSHSAAGALLSRHPDTKGIVAQSDGIAEGVLSAIKAAGKVPGKDIFVVSNDGTTAGVKAVKNGELLATVGNVPSYAGYLLVTNLYDRLNGWKPSAPERLLTWDPLIIDEENVDAYIKRFVDLPVEKHFDAKLMSKVESPDSWDPQFDLYPAELEDLFGPLTKPNGYETPAPYTEAKADGTFDKVTGEYRERYKRDILGPPPSAS